MQIKNLFRKIEEYYYVTVGTDGERINMPMYNTNFTIYKGVPNKIFFSVRNCDRKRVKLEDNQTLKRIYSSYSPLLFLSSAIVSKI